jgi:mannose-6-phosphate isomerase-like protein (cupin superfamily)
MDLDKGITRAGEGHPVRPWTVAGALYTPQLVCDAAFLWHAQVPADTFVPHHIHPTQDEWIIMQSGHLDVEFGTEKLTAGPGDTVRMPRGIAHGYFNRSGAEVLCLFGVSPARKLFELFTKLDGVTDGAELARISAEHEVNFLPPPD